MGGWTAVNGRPSNGGWSGLATFSPTNLAKRLLLRAGDPLSASPQGRIVNGTARMVDHSRSGTARQMQPGRSYLFAGVSDKIVVGDVGSIAHVSVWIKFAATNQVILTFQNSTATAVSVSAGVLTFGGTLTAGGIYVDGVSKTAAQAGALLNDLAWHRLDFDLTAVSASNLVLGTDSSAFGNFYAFDFRAFASTLSADEVLEIADMVVGDENLGRTDPAVWYKGDEGGTYATAIDCSGNSNDGTITAAAIGSFQDEAANDQYSFQNELGYTDDSGVSGALIPRNESLLTQDANGGALQYSGKAPHDPIVSSPCLTTNGTNDWVVFPDLDFERTDSFSVMGWVWLTTGDSGSVFGQLESSGNLRGFDIWKDAGNLIYILLVNTWASNVLRVRTNAAVPVGEWMHLVLTYDGSSSASGVTIYINGASVALTTLNDTLSATMVGTGDTRLAARADFAEVSALRATDLHVYKRELSSAEVTAAYAGTAPATTSLQMRVPFSEADGTTIYDTSGNGDHGSLTTASEAASWANTQNVFDTLVTDGYRRTGTVNIPALVDGSAAADTNPLTHGPGVLSPDQTIDLGGGEANSPYAQQLDAILTGDLTYAAGDDDEDDILFARTTANGDDRILVASGDPVLSALTGQELTDVQDYCT